MALKKREDKGHKDISQSKIYIFFDWLWKLFVINVVTIVTSLGIITILPSLVAAFRTIKECKEEDQTKYIRSFYRNFVYSFKDSIGVGILWLIFLGIFIFGFIFYSAMIDNLRESGNYPGWLNVYSILLGFDFIFFMITLILFFELPKVITYFHLRFFDKIRLTLYMTFRYFGRGLMVFIIFAIEIILMPWIPIIMFMVGFSFPLYIGYVLMNRPYWILLNKMEYLDTEDEYDLKGKVHNRETYEDKTDEEKINSAVKELEKLNKDITGEKK